VRASQEGADAGLQFGEVERFRQVVVGARVQARHTVLQSVQRGQHQQRQRRLRRAYPLQHRQAVDHRQPEVEHGDVEGLAQQQVLGYRAIGCHLDRESGLPEACTQGVGKNGVVFCEQQLHLRKLNGLTPN
jgi:hypothetical protein